MPLGTFRFQCHTQRRYKAKPSSPAMGLKMDRPIPEDAHIKDAVAATVASEEAIKKVCFEHLQPGPFQFTDIFGLAIGKRALGLSSGYRLMVEQANSICALPLVRMQLDTVLRLYAGFFAPDHREFCKHVFGGAQINRMKSFDGVKMTDRFLVEKISLRNPWMSTVYNETSGYVHFSGKHMLSLFNVDGNSNFQVVIGDRDFGKDAQYYIEPTRCIHHLNLLIEFGLRDWFGRMCRLDGRVPDADEFWRSQNDTPSGDAA